MLGAADARVRPVSKRLVVGNFVLGERGLYRSGGAAEEAHDRTARSQHPDDLTGQRLRGCLRQIVEHVPAQNPVDGRVLVAEALVQSARELVERARARVSIVVGKQILDEEFAAELLAKKRHVGANDGPEIDQHRRFGLMRNCRQELRQRLRGDEDIATARGRRVARRIGLARAFSAPAEKV